MIRDLNICNLYILENNYIIFELVRVRIKANVDLDY